MEFFFAEPIGARTPATPPHDGFLLFLAAGPNATIAFVQLWTRKTAELFATYSILGYFTTHRSVIPKEDAVKSTHTREYAAFMEGLIKARKKHGLTQRAVADQLGKPQSFVSKYESGERRLDVVEFLHVARVLREDPALLLQEMGLY